MPAPPANYLLKRSCWELDPGNIKGQGLTQTLGNGQTLEWQLGYTLGNAWVQAQGGDVTSAGIITSLTPAGISPREFVLDGAGAYPGVVTYGTSFDFAIETTGSDPTGTDFVSSRDWLVNETYATTDWYDTFYRRFGSPTTADYDCSASPCTINQPASRTTPYYVLGDMATQGNWNVGDSENLIFIVDGDLSLDGGVSLTGKGFVSFIVKGDITVSSSVGSPYTNSTAADIEGVYVTSPTGTFATGTSTTPGKARLVLKGSFISGNFLLERDLAIVGQNTTTSSELFIFNPLLLITMPDVMKEVKVTWQEVTP